LVYPGGSSEPPLSAFIAFMVTAVDRNRPSVASPEPSVMKQILLSVPAIFAEVRFGKFAETLRRYFPSIPEVLLP
jgi:hypothetical protein